jgi:integrase
MIPSIRSVAIARFSHPSEAPHSDIQVEHGWDDREGEISPKAKAGVRLVPMPETLRVILAAHVKTTARKGDDLAFGRSASEPFTQRSAAFVADAAWEKANVQRVVLHEARHAYKSFLDAAGVSESRADRYAGHSRTDVGDRYRHQLRGQLAVDAKLLDDYLTGKEPGNLVEFPAESTGAQTGAHAAQVLSLSQAH